MDIYQDLFDMGYGPLISNMEKETAMAEAYSGPVPPVTEDHSIFKREEVRVVDTETGGMKGSKLARFDMIPADVLWELAEHYGKGEAKYPSDETGQPNWQRGYSWRLSVAALERHLNLWKQGEDLDDETGSSHLIAALWHVIALRWFQIHGKGRDFREVK